MDQKKQMEYFVVTIKVLIEHRKTEVVTSFLYF